MKLLPTPQSVIVEAVTVIAGAVLAAFVIGRLPELRDWMRQQWDGLR